MTRKHGDRHPCWQIEGAGSKSPIDAHSVEQLVVPDFSCQASTNESISRDYDRDKPRKAARDPPEIVLERNADAFTAT